MEAEELEDEQHGGDDERAEDAEENAVCQRRQSAEHVGEPLALRLDIDLAHARVDVGADLHGRQREDAAEEPHEVGVVLAAHARVEPRAVVVEGVDALVAPDGARGRERGSGRGSARTVGQERGGGGGAQSRRGRQHSWGSDPRSLSLGGVPMRSGDAPTAQPGLPSRGHAEPRAEPMEEPEGGASIGAGRGASSGAEGGAREQL